MEQKPSFLWALALAIVFPILLALMFLLVGQISETQPIDYLWFFAGGGLIGLAVIYFLRRSESRNAFRVVLVTSIIGIPFSLFGMNFGRVIGPIGVLFLGVSPAVFLTIVGYYFGKLFIKR